MRPAIQAAQNAGLKTATHAQGMEGIKNALRAGIDSVEHGLSTDDWCFDFMKQHGAVLDPTLSAMYWIKVKAAAVNVGLGRKESGNTIDAHTASVAAAYKAGVKVTCSGPMPEPFKQFREGGMRNGSDGRRRHGRRSFLRSGTIPQAAQLAALKRLTARSAREKPLISMLRRQSGRGYQAVMDSHDCYP